MPNDGYEIKMSGAQTARLIEYRRRRDILIGKHEKALATADDAAKAKDAVEQDSADKPVTDTAAEEKKPDDQKPEDSPAAPADEAKPSEEAKPTDAKPADEKPAEERPAEVPADKPADGEKLEKPADHPPVGADEEATETTSTFVDTQLQKAVDYLSSELAKAP
jgi:hypothetical protein